MRGNEELAFLFGGTVCVFFVGLILWCAALDPHSVRCAERWRYQVTATDTLRTVRGGCGLPTPTPEPRRD